MALQWNLPWLTHNSQRNYPLVAEASCVDSTGTFTLPQDFIVALDIPVHAAMDVNSSRFFIESVGVYPSGYSISVGYDNGINVVRVATALISKNNFQRDSTYALGGVEPYDDTVGKVTIGRLETIDLQPAGLWFFTLETAKLEPDAIRPMIRGVQSISIVSGVEKSARYTGDIELVAGTNMQIVPTLLASNVTRLTFSAISGEGTIEPCICEGEEADTPCIKRINNILPTTAGDFTFIGNECVDFEPVAFGLKLNDICCKPCCGPTELEAITQDLIRFEQQKATQEQFLSTLQSSVTTFSNTVLGARLGDRSCVNCG